MRVAVLEAGPFRGAVVVTRREKPEDFLSALNRQPNDINVVVQFNVA